MTLTTTPTREECEVIYLPIEYVRPNPYQPRQEMDSRALDPSSNMG